MKKSLWTSSHWLCLVVIFCLPEVFVNEMVRIFDDWQPTRWFVDLNFFEL